MDVEVGGVCVDWGGVGAVLLVISSSLFLTCCSSIDNVISMFFRLSVFLVICARIWQGQSEDQEVSEEGPKFEEVGEKYLLCKESNRLSSRSFIF